MLPTMLEVIGVTLLIGFVISIIRASKRPDKFPPGPYCLPLVGYIPFLDIRNLNKSFKRLTRRYGDVFSIYLGRKPVVVLNSYKLIREAFDMREMSGRPSMFSGTFFQKGQVGITTTEGQPWEAQRHFFHRHMNNLVNGKGVNRFQEIILDEVHDIKMNMTKMEGEVVPISYHLNVSIINILWTITSGRHLHNQQQEFQSVYECIDKITQFMSRAAIMTFLPFLATVLPESISKMEKGRYHRNRFLGISKKWISEHKEQYKGNRAGDFQDAYLEKIQEGDPFFTEENLGAVLREMFVIGAETQSVLLRWAVRLLSVHTDIQRRMVDEMDDVLEEARKAGRQHDNVVWEDRDSLPYTRAVIAEVQRFADITPTALGHKATSDVNFHGYVIPKGTSVLANITACNRNPVHWDKPEDFYPEHFLDGQQKFIENKEGFIPFGTGIRQCPAECVAQMTMFLILTNLVRAFKLRAPAGDNLRIGTQYEVGTGFIRNPKPFKIILHVRE